MFVAALFIIVNTWEQPRCPSMGEWINYDMSRQMEYDSALIGNELSSHEKTQEYETHITNLKKPI